MEQITKGATSRSIYFSIDDSTSTSGAKKTGLAYNTSGLTAYYCRKVGSATAITLATQTATGAWSSGGFVEVDATNMPGLYRLDVPDAAFATGANGVVVTLKGATGMVQADKEIQLVGFDPQDTIRLGLTALPNAAAGANGGLPTGDASGHVTFANTSIATVTDLTNLPSIPANWLTAAGIAASALNGKGDWNIGKTGYSLTQAFPSNFSSLAITVGGAVTVGTNGDKTGYSLTQAFPTNFADMAITATTGQVTVGTNNDKTGYTASTVSDKTGYSLTSAYDAAKTAAQVSDIPSASTIATAVWGVLTSALTTASTVGKLIVDYLDAAVSTRSTYAGADTAGTTTLLTRIPSAITITGGLVDVNDKTGFALTTAYDPAKTAAQAGDAMTLTTAYDFAKGTVAMTEDYAVNGAAPTPAQALMAIHQDKFSFAISGTSKTVKKLDNLTSAYVVTLNSATTPTGATRS